MGGCSQVRVTDSKSFTSSCSALQILSNMTWSLIARRGAGILQLHFFQTLLFTWFTIKLHQKRMYSNHYEDSVQNSLPWHHLTRACTVNVMDRQAYMRGLWLIGNLLHFNVFREARFSRTEGTSENVETLSSAKSSAGFFIPFFPLSLLLLCHPEMEGAPQSFYNHEYPFFGVADF